MTDNDQATNKTTGMSYGEAVNIIRNADNVSISRKVMNRVQLEEHAVKVTKAGQTVLYHFSEEVASMREKVTNLEISNTLYEKSRQQVEQESYKLRKHISQRDVAIGVSLFLGVFMILSMLS